MRDYSLTPLPDRRRYEQLQARQREAEKLDFDQILASSPELRAAASPAPTTADRLSMSVQRARRAQQAVVAPQRREWARAHRRLR